MEFRFEVAVAIKQGDDELPDAATAAEATYEKANKALWTTRFWEFLVVMWVKTIFPSETATFHRKANMGALAKSQITKI
jgi:hypothetical protein